MPRLLRKIIFREDIGGAFHIEAVWTDDRHNRAVSKGPATPKTVSVALRQLAFRIEMDEDENE